MKVHLFIQVCILSSKIERYHLEFDSNWAISSNDFIQYIAKYSLKKIYIAFEQKIAQKKNAGRNLFMGLYLLSFHLDLGLYLLSFHLDLGLYLH
jgi:hypothetical protein